MRKSTSDESERNTRKRLIDPKLRAAGWRVVRFDAAAPVRQNRRPRHRGVPDRQRPGRLRPVRRRPAPRRRRGQEGHARAAERPDPGRALRAGRDAEPVQLRRLPRPVPLLHQRRGHLVPRRPPPAEPLAPDRRLPHARRPCGRCSRRDFDAACELARRHPERPPAAAAVPDRGERGRSSRPSRTASGRCSSRWRPAPARPSRWSTRSTG